MTDNYQHILHQNDDTIIQNNTFRIEKSLAWNCFLNFVTHRKLDTGEKTLIISLSGGVDSMVFLYLCMYYKSHKKSVFKFGIVHINWNQRAESKLEADFLLKYADEHNVLSYFENIETLFRSENRELFESQGKDIRFNVYKQCVHDWNGDSVFLGHHKGDIVENVFTNMIHGNHFLDLGKMRTESNINNVRIVRPFLEIHKSDIYEVAFQCNIPFFKDTTPAGSNRGTLRHTIFPLIRAQFGKGFETGLLNMSRKSSEIGNLIQECIITPYLDKVKYMDKQIRLPYEKSYPYIFYEIIFEKIMYSIEQPKIRNKTLQSWHNYITSVKGEEQKSYTVRQNCRLLLNDNVIFINFL